MEIPVYLFVGFLESGKTSFIQKSLEYSDFNSGEKTLLLLCEEGIEELDKSKFYGQNIYTHVIESTDELNMKNLSELRKKCNAERVVIEYNGMWQLDELLNNLPKGWIIYQQMMSADARTFLSYNANMRSLVYDKLQNSEFIIFNRYDDSIDKMELHKIVRAVSRNIDIAYEYKDGTVIPDDIEDPLPFDINADIIEIADDDFALWYRDLMERTDEYDGKTVKFTGIVAVDKRIPGKAFVIGRHIMTCCEDDIAYGGVVCKWSNLFELKSRDWVNVTAKISIEYNKIYQGEGPVLSAIHVIRASKPEREVVTF